MVDLMLDTPGSQVVSMDQLRLVPTPLQTRTYHPVPFHDLVELAIHRFEWVGYEVSSTQYAIARGGRHFFGVLNMTEQTTDLQLSVGLRSSHDRTLAAGIVAGARVFVCSNLCFGGDIRYVRKHTRGVWDDLAYLMESAAEQAGPQFTTMAADLERMKVMPLDDDEAYALLGIMRGRNLLPSRQFGDALTEWDRPSHDAWDTRNVHRLYMAVTEALKTTPPNDALERHTTLHRFMAREVL